MDGRLTEAKSALSGPSGRILRIVAIAVSLAIAAFLVGLDRYGLLWEAPDRVTYDWRTYLFSERAKATRDDIVLILVDEGSLTGYPYLSPVDRGMTAELIRQIGEARPAAIGLDFIFDRQTEPAKDDALLAVLKDVNARVPVVIGAIDVRSTPELGRLPVKNIAEPPFQQRVIKEAGLRAGHIYFATHRERLAIGDQAVRFHASLDSGREAFSQVLAEAVGKGFEPTSRLVYWRHPPKAGGSHFVPTFTLPPHRDMAGKQTGPVLPESWRDGLRGKIVLVGGAFMDRDLHYTPFSVATAAPVHGIEIHTQMLAQRLDKRSVYVMDWWQEYLLVAVVAGLGFLAALFWRVSRNHWKTSTLAFVVFVGASFGAFAAFFLILPTATLFIAWPAGLLAGEYARRIMRGLMKEAS
jgi:CHASE2 domain-containing sensor protein